MIIGLNGKAGSGKDAFAGFLGEVGFTRYAFADAVREAALTINPILSTNWRASPEHDPKLEELRLADVVESYGWDRAKREIAEVRRLLQVIGTEMGRNILGENCWVDIVAKQIAQGDGKAVIADLRFPNEAEYVKENDGLIVNIIRDRNPHAINTAHPSEQYKPDADIVIYNDGSLEDLRDQALTIAYMASGKEITWESLVPSE